MASSEQEDAGAWWVLLPLVGVAFAVSVGILAVGMEQVRRAVVADQSKWGVEKDCA